MIFRILIPLLIALTVAGCRGEDAPPSNAQTARIGFGIGPSARASGVDVLAQILYAEPLFGQDWSGRQTRRLVQGWNWSPDGTTLTLDLKKGVKFHDGSPLSADTVVRFLRNNAFRRAEGASSPRFGLEHVKNIDSSGENTITLSLSRPDFFLLPALNELMLTHPEKNEVATGPFSLVSRTPVLEVKRFADYHGGPSPMAGVTIQTFDTQRSAWAALMRGEVDVVQEVDRTLVEFASDNVATYPSVQAFYLALVFNHRHAALKNVEVRRAMVQAIDRAAIIDRAMGGKGRLAEDPIWPFNWAYPANSSRHQFDPASASDRLDRAGFRLPPIRKQGERRKRLSFRCMVYNEDPQFERMALLIQRHLFDVGVVMDVELVDLKTLVARASLGDYDALLIQMYSGRAMDYTYRFWRSGANESQMVNSGYTGADHLLDSLRLSLSDENTTRIVNDLTRTFHEDVPAVFLAWTEVTRAVSTRFDVGESKGQDPLFNIWQWRVREGPAGR